MRSPATRDVAKKEAVTSAEITEETIGTESVHIVQTYIIQLLVWKEYQEEIPILETS